MCHTHRLQDGNGSLTADEVIAAVDKTGKMTVDEARDLIACHDLNRDGVIDYSGTGLVLFGRHNVIFL